MKAHISDFHTYIKIKSLNYHNLSKSNFLYFLILLYFNLTLTVFVNKDYIPTFISYI